MKIDWEDEVETYSYGKIHMKVERTPTGMYRLVVTKLETGAKVHRTGDFGGLEKAINEIKRWVKFGELW